MTKRQKVYDKFNGRCAYCGCELKAGFHIDHIEPIRRNSDGCVCVLFSICSGFVNRESVIVSDCVERNCVVIIQQLVCCVVDLTDTLVLFRVYGHSVYDVVCCHSHSFLAICNFFSISLTSLLAYCKLIPCERSIVPFFRPSCFAFAFSSSNS